MYEKILQKTGLTEKQARVYLACLELGCSKATDIARQADLKRTTTYGILDELLNQGLISSSQKGRLKFFEAQDPKTILNIMESNRREVESIMPDLENIFATLSLRPRVQFFEGSEGIKRILENTLQCNSKKLLQIVKVKEWNKLFKEEYTFEYIKKRSELNIWSYAIHPSSDDTYNEIYGTENKKLKRSVRYLPSNMFYASIIMIYDHKVSMISTEKENFGFVIESKEFSNTLRAYFNFMWKMGSKNPPKHI